MGERIFYYMLCGERPESDQLYPGTGNAVIKKEEKNGRK